MEDSLGSDRQIPLAFKHKCSLETLGKKRNAACSESQKSSPWHLGCCCICSLPEHPAPGTHGGPTGDPRPLRAVPQLGVVPLTSSGYAQGCTSCCPVTGDGCGPGPSSSDWLLIFLSPPRAVGVSRGLGPTARTPSCPAKTRCRRGPSPLSFLHPHTPLGLCGRELHLEPGPKDGLLQLLFHFSFRRKPSSAASLAAPTAGSSVMVPFPSPPALAWATDAARQSRRLHGETSAVFLLVFSSSLF